MLGLITAYDIMGEKPLRYAQEMGGVREQVVASDIMEPIAEWNVLRMSDVDGATVANLLDAFKQSRRTHLPVIEEAAARARLRGVFSSAKLLRLTAASRRAAPSRSKRSPGL